MIAIAQRSGPVQRCCLGRSLGSNWKAIRKRLIALASRWLTSEQNLQAIHVCDTPSGDAFYDFGQDRLPSEARALPFHPRTGTKRIILRSSKGIKGSSTSSNRAWTFGSNSRATEAAPNAGRAHK